MLAAPPVPLHAPGTSPMGPGVTAAALLGPPASMRSGLRGLRTYATATRIQARLRTQVQGLGPLTHASCRNAHQDGTINTFAMCVPGIGVHKSAPLLCTAVVSSCSAAVFGHHALTGEYEEASNSRWRRAAHKDMSNADCKLNLRHSPVLETVDELVKLYARTQAGTRGPFQGYAHAAAQS